MGNHLHPARHCTPDSLAYTGLTNSREIDMTEQATTNPAVERFLQFMTADIEGRREDADRLMAEMVEKDGVPESLAIRSDRNIRCAAK